MAVTAPGLGDVLNLALKEWKPRAVQGRGALFGAAGLRGVEIDREMRGLVQSLRKRLAIPEIRGSDLSTNPMDRLFGTEIGPRVASVIGNETRTLAALQRLSVEVIADSLRLTGMASEADRLLVMPGQQLIPDQPERPPILMLMSPKVGSVQESRVVSDEIDLPLWRLRKGLEAVDALDQRTPEAVAWQQLLHGGDEALAELFLIAQPEIVLTRRPRMIPLCVPSPHLKVTSGGKLSTAGVLCRDADGALGVTACFHGTGLVGTEVTVGSYVSRVKRVSEVQDTVFVPLDNSFSTSPMVGLGGVLEDHEPAKADRVQFDGAINQNRKTRIFSTDTGLLRARPTIMLKLQTDPDTDQGDSGSALIDEHDRVLGFAFERTAYDDYPQFTDWIWAANAFRALGLKRI